MKITESQAVRSPTPQVDAAKNVRADGERTAGETLELREAPRAPQDRTVSPDVLDTAQQKASSVRAERLQSIEDAVRKGHYPISSERIAEEILNTAEISAKLRAIFG